VAEGLFRSKVDGFVPETQRVNLGKVRQVGLQVFRAGEANGVGGAGMASGAVPRRAQGAEREALKDAAAPHARRVCRFG
jgi:hypothetical protein